MGGGGVVRRGKRIDESGIGKIREGGGILEGEKRVRKMS
jgi:hypothetical protein